MGIEMAETIFPSSIKAFNEKKCPTCQKPIGRFRNDISKQEYRISGLCQECQDSVFGED